MSSKPTSTANEAYQNFKGLLKRAFFGLTPPFFKSIKPELFENFNKAVEAQGFKSVYELNYVQLIQDFGKYLSPQILRAKMLSESEIKSVQFQHRVLFNTAYLELIPMEAFSPTFKIDAGYFIKELFATFKKIYGIEMIESQEDFIALIDEYEIKFREEERIKEIEWEHKFIRDRIEKYSPLTEEWPSSKEELERLSHLLVRGRFTSSPDSFKNAFLKINYEPCNWLKKQTSFVFLVGFIYGEDECPEVLKTITTKFLFKGEFKTVETLQQSFRNIKDKYQSANKDLRGEFLEIRKITSQFQFTTSPLN